MKKHLVALALTAIAVAVPLALAGCGRADAAERFTDVEKQTREFMRYNETIELDPEQEAVFRRALSQIPAPCCSTLPGRCRSSLWRTASCRRPTTAPAS